MYKDVMKARMTVTEQREKRDRLWWLVYVLLFLCTLSGCALTTTYRYADRIILWQIDHYFDLNRPQRHDLAQRLTPLLAKHRDEALPQYEAFLQDVRRRIERGLTGSDVDWAYATYDRLRTDLFERVVTDAGAFLASVDQQQVRTFSSVLQQDNAKAARLAQAPPSERLHQRAETTTDWLKDWLGSLTKEQRDQIYTWSLALPDTQPVWFVYQQQRQQELLTLLHQPRSPEQAAQKLRATLIAPDPSGVAPYQEAVHQMRESAKTMALAIDHQVSDEQRRHAVVKLQRLIDQIHTLQVG